MTNGELRAIGQLKALLETAKHLGYPVDRMLVCDGYLAALRTISCKEYGYSETDVFIRDGKDIKYV